MPNVWDCDALIVIAARGDFVAVAARALRCAVETVEFVRGVVAVRTTVFDALRALVADAAARAGDAVRVLVDAAVRVLVVRDVDGARVEMDFCAIDCVRDAASVGCVVPDARFTAVPSRTAASTTPILAKQARAKSEILFIPFAFIISNNAMRGQGLNIKIAIKNPALRDWDFSCWLSDPGRGGCVQQT